MKYFIKTYGCQQNVRDSQDIASVLEKKGYRETKDLKEADLVVVNTCEVRESAENRARGFLEKLKKLKKKKKNFKIILNGCMVGLYGKRKLLEWFPHVDDFKIIEDWKINKNLFRPKAKEAFVNISTGCNNFCTYCVVPYSRGREKSIPFDNIICEVKNLVKRGIECIVLLGQNVNSWGKDLKKTKGISFAELLVTIHEIPGVKKISFLTSNPWDFIDDIIEAMVLPKIDRYLHLPVQSGDDEILRKMNRRHTADEYLDLVNKIKNKVPDIEIGTDIIVGFPGETKKQFENTVKLCQKVGFVKAYVSRYSPRPKTAAFKLKDDVPPGEKKRRWLILENLINKSLA